MSMKDVYVDIFNNFIKRNGSEKLLAWLESSDFFTAPASTKYHSSYEGGLCQHSLNVYERLRKLYSDEMTTDGVLTPEDEEKVAIVGLLHDVCKVNYYKQGTRNVKDENGKWQQVPTYNVEDTFPYGHGEKSVYLIELFMRLKHEEAMAIRWHMGAWGESQSGERSAGASYERFPLALLAHMADMMATYIDEKE